MPGAELGCQTGPMLSLIAGVGLSWPHYAHAALPVPQPPVLPLLIISLRVRHESIERSATADRTEATLANEPTEKADKNDPMEPIERTDPTEAIDRIEPREPIHKIEFSDLIDSNELWRVLTSPIMTDQPAS
jgi:hypothetical protein